MTGRRFIANPLISALWQITLMVRGIPCERSWMRHTASRVNIVDARSARHVHPRRDVLPRFSQVQRHELAPQARPAA